jgi:acyl carrier protein
MARTSALFLLLTSPVKLVIPQPPVRYRHGFIPDAIMNPLYSTLTKLLEVDTLQPDDILRDFDNWDSLTILSLCATLDGHFGISLSAQDLKEVSTVTDLEQLIAARRAA